MNKPKTIKPIETEIVGYVISYEKLIAAAEEDEE
jgi:hypothetical protein